MVTRPIINRFWFDFVSPTPKLCWLYEPFLVFERSLFLFENLISESVAREPCLLDPKISEKRK